MLLAALLWSTSGLFIKVLEMHALTLSAWRAVFAALALLPLLRPSQFRFSPALLLLMLTYGGTMVGFVYATRFTTAANAIALQSTSPGWVFLFTCLVLRRVPLALLPPMGALLAGIAVMMSEGDGGAGEAAMLGNLIAVSTGLTFAMTHLAFSRIAQPPAGAIIATNLLVAAVCFLLTPEDPLAAVEGTEWAAVIYLGAAQIGLAFWCFTIAFRYIPVPQASMLTLLEPLLNPVWVWLMIAELPSIHGVLGMAFILAGLLGDTVVRVWRPDLRRFTPGAGP